MSDEPTSEVSPLRLRRSAPPSPPASEREGAPPAPAPAGEAASAAVGGERARKRPSLSMSHETAPPAPGSHPPVPGGSHPPAAVPLPVVPPPVEPAVASEPTGPLKLRVGGRPPSVFTPESAPPIPVPIPLAPLPPLHAPFPPPAPFVPPPVGAPAVRGGNTADLFGGVPSGAPLMPLPVPAAPAGAPQVPIVPNMGFAGNTTNPLAPLVPPLPAPGAGVGAAPGVGMSPFAAKVAAALAADAAGGASGAVPVQAAHRPRRDLAIFGILFAVVVCGGFWAFRHFRAAPSAAVAEAAPAPVVAPVATPTPDAAAAPVAAPAPAEVAVAAPVQTGPVVAPASPVVVANGVGNPSDAFTRYVEGVRVTGVFQGSPARALIDGKLIRAGELVNPALGVRLLGVNVATRQLIFADASGAEARIKY